MKELIEIQKELNVPKAQENKFGGFMYRSCEDILEAVKPLCCDRGVLLTLSDKMVAVGDRVYVEVTATVSKDGQEVSVTASARESDVKKGMDASQITGSASSYARKTALGGLFCLDDAKDADTTENELQRRKGGGAQVEGATKEQIDFLTNKAVELEAAGDNRHEWISNQLKGGLTKSRADYIIGRFK